MSCSGWLVGLWLLASGSSAVAGDGCRARARSRPALDHRARGGGAERPGRAVGPEGETQAAEQVRRPDSPAGSAGWCHAARCRCRKSSTPAPESRKRCRAELEEIQTRAGRRASSTWPSARRRPSRRNMRWPACASARSSSGSPITSEARRLLGYVPYQGRLGHAVRGRAAQARGTSITRSSAGCRRTGYRTSTVASCPRRLRSRQKKTRWLPAAEADRLRADWKPPWQISTEHFEIQTNVPLAEAISFGRRLEAFHDLFMALMADILGENLPLVRRFKNPAMTGDGQAAARLHLVYYFALEGRIRRASEPDVRARDRGQPGLLRPAQVGPAAARRPTSSATRTARSP